MARILVTEEIAEAGLDRLRSAGHTVDVLLDCTPADLLTAIVGANALIIRSATKVDRELLAAGTDLVAVGRAGIGLDNVDLDAATERGVMVVNAPQSNIVSAAEHTMALLLAQARNVPQAHAALVAGRWERSKWEGVELADKTLGIVGLGRIGKLVADRARGFGMRLVAYDPFVSAEQARQGGVELLPLDQVVAEADFLTIHLPKTPETTGLIGRDLLLKAKPSLRIINVARGGIVDEAALADAIRDGLVAGAGLDVFASEPTTESPLFGIDVRRGHAAPRRQHPRGPGQGRRHDRRHGPARPRRRLRPVRREPVGGRGARVVAPVPAAGRAARGAVRVARRRARRRRRSRSPSRVTSARYDTRIVGLSVLKGVFGRIADEPVTYVNAPQRAQEHGHRGSARFARPRRPTTST